jgi:hypothetical protein
VLSVFLSLIPSYIPTSATSPWAARAVALSLDFLPFTSPTIYLTHQHINTTHHHLPAAGAVLFILSDLIAIHHPQHIIDSPLQVQC